MKVLFISGSPREASRSRRLVEAAHAYAMEAHGGHEVRLLDLHERELPGFRGFEADYPQDVWDLVREVTEADVLLIGSPVFNGGYAAAIKNLFEFVDYKAMEGHVAGFVLVGGGSMSFLQARTQLAQLMVYFNVFVVPRAVFAKRGDVDEGIDAKLQGRLEELVDDAIAVRAALLQVREGKARQRPDALAAAVPGGR